MTKEEPLSLNAEEAIIIFTAQGDFISRINRFVDSVEFYSIPLHMQKFMIENKELHEATYKKVAAYLSTKGCGQVPMDIFNFDTKNNIKPRGGI